MFGDGENRKELVHANRVEERDGDRTADADNDGYGYVSYDGSGSGFSGRSRSNIERSSEGDAQTVKMFAREGENEKELAHANKVERRDEDNGSGPGCLTNQEAYLGNDCCAGTCATSLNGCFDCPTTPQQDPANYGGPSCFQNGACIAQEPAGVCNAPSRKRPRGTGTEYAGWCACPTGSFCHGSGCNSTTPRNMWNPDEVRICTACDCVCSCVCSC